VSSFINKVLKNKKSRKSGTSKKDPDLNELENVTNIPQKISPTVITDITQKKFNLDIPQIIVGIGQSVGVQRDHNEDSLFTLTTNLVSGDKTIHFGLYMIADGMGGHENGEIASSVAVDTLSSHVINSLYLPLVLTPGKKSEMSIQEIMQSGVILAHQKIKKEALGSGTTLSSALILGNQLTIAHVGDSRAYLINSDGNLQLLTHDHSLVKRLEEIGQISQEQALTHPQRNVLYRALGQGEPFEPDIATYQLQPGNKLILCSDGLWGVIPDKDMETIIRSSSEPQNVCQELVNLANSAGGPDNISVIIVQIVE
jgi:serine/threonine protein phosphatase PrpC